MDDMHACVCCLQCSQDKDLTTSYTHHGRTEIYTVMLKDCFNIQLVLDGWGSCVICSLCAGRLRDASDFKLQVQRCQAELRARSQPKTSVYGSIKPEPEWCEEASCVKEEPPYSETTGAVSGVSEAAVLAGVSEATVLAGVSEAAGLAGVSEAAVLAGVSEAAVLAGVSEAAMLAGLYDDHVVKDELVLGPERPHRPCVGSTLQEQSPVKQEPATVEETALLDSERAVKSEVPDGAARAEDGPAREYCENEYIMQSSVLLRAESPVSLRARSQLAAACAVSRSSSYKHPKHQTQMSSTDHKPYQCSQCEYKTSDKSNLQRHQRIHTGEKPFKCDYCDFNCSHKSYLQTLQRIHTGEKPFQCGYCDYKSSVKSHIHTHQMIHTGKKPFKCGSCDYNCGQKSHLQRHERIHTGEKSFKCGYCDYKCRYKSTLQSHQRIHTGEKPFQCGYCDYKCAHKSNLVIHQRIHTGEKPFQCGYCDYKSRWKSYLLLHQRKHTGEKPFQCDFCDYKTGDKSHLQRHQKIHTG